MIDYEKKMDERTRVIAEYLAQIRRVNWFGYGFVTGVMIVTIMFSIIYWRVG